MTTSPPTGDPVPVQSATGPGAPAPVAPPGPGGEPAPVAPPGPGGEPALFRPRLRAFLMDLLVLGGAVAFVIVPLYICAAMLLFDPVTTVDGRVVEGGGFAAALGEFGLTVVAVAIALAVAYIYHVEVPLRRNGQTFGKRRESIRVVSLTPGGQLSRRQLSTRLLAQAGMGIVPGLGQVDGLSQLWDRPHRQCLHDKVAKTTVVRLTA